MEDFEIIECETDRIIVNREPQNEEEATIMRLAAQDAIIQEKVRLKSFEYNPTIV